MQIRPARPIPVTAVGCASALGFSWKGFCRGINKREIQLVEPTELRGSSPRVLAAEVPPIPAEFDAGDARQHKLMSRAARLAAVAARQALRDAGISAPRDGVGFFLGVGASGGAMSDLLAVLGASMEGDGVSLAKLGDKGLSASNPVGTFHLLNNFTLCHSAIIEGVTGPNGAFFSRGGGTVFALMEALNAIDEGECDRALAGGADSALHPVTWAELVREGYLEPEQTRLGEGAAILALAKEAAEPIAFIEGCSLHSVSGSLADADKRAPHLSALSRLMAAEVGASSNVDLIALAPWGGPAREALRSFATDVCPEAKLIDTTAALGDSLAASPALAWAAAIDALAEGIAERALVLSAGIDGQVGSVILSSPTGAPLGGRS